MRRWLGICLIAIGLTIGLYHYMEWHTGRTAAQDLTAEELQTIKRVEQELSKPAIVQKEPPKLESPEAKPELSKEPPPAPPSPVLTSSMEYTGGEQVATLLVPKLEQKYSVYWGADDATLTKGVGMFVSDLTTVPGGNGHTVLSGHRDTVFTELGKLEVADRLIVEYKNRTFAYEITDIWITHKDDRSVIVAKDESILTLTTCYPFEFLGDAPDRYIVQAKLISSPNT